LRAVEIFIAALHFERMAGFKDQHRRRIRRTCLVKVLQKVAADSAQPPRTPQLPRLATSFKRRHCRLQTATNVNTYDVAHMMNQTCQRLRNRECLVEMLHKFTAGS
jgi:hypothetical protein